MTVLVACEESQVVTRAFRALGVEAFSCDTLPTSGGNPEWHLQEDVLPLLERSWDLVLAFPPCTHLATSGARWFAEKRRSGVQAQAIDFFLQFAQYDRAPVAIENPVGIMSTVFRKPDQIVQPYEFGDPFRKTTCLWLRGLPHLKPTNVVEPQPSKVYADGTRMQEWFANVPKRGRSRARSKTFPGLALAMATQWSMIL